MDENFFTNESYEKYNKLNQNHFIGDFTSDKDADSEIYDSLNINLKLNNNNNNNISNDNINNFSINNEDSVLQDAFNSLSNNPNKNNKNKNKNINNIQEKNIQKNIIKENEPEKIRLNTYSRDNNQENNSIQINEEENVNLGVSYGRISDPEKYSNSLKYIKIINEDNNNQGVITPNTSIYNLSETITKKSEQFNNIEMLNNEKGSTKNENQNLIYEDNSLYNNKNMKENITIVEYNTNKNEEENKLMFNINCQFSKIKKSENEENEIKSNNDGNIDLNKIIENNIALKKNKRHNDIISKRFEYIKKNKKQLLNTNSSSPLNINSSNVFVKDSLMKESNNNEKIFKTSLTNSINENNKYIYLCPFCNKETPEIIKLEGIQEENDIQTIDKISITCSCGNYELDLIEYINILEQKNSFNNLKEKCYNENHEPIKASIYCSKCNKWFCEQCLIFHKSLLPDHIITPTKIPKFSKCQTHQDNDILYFCNKCKIGFCEKCKTNSHCDHIYFNINDYFNRTYNSLPFKSFEELNEYIEHCNRISEKEKISYINYIEDMINKLNNLKNEIIENYNISKKRRMTQQKLVKYLFGNFICFNDNYQQIKNMNSINYICPTLFLYNDINFIKNANNYSLYLKKESFIEINPDRKLDREEITNIFDKYKPILKEIINNNSLDTNIKNYNSNKIYINTLQSESNFTYPTLFKIYNNTGIYYGEINNNKRNGIGKQFNNKNEFEGIWDDGEIIKGKAIYFSDQGNIIYEGEFKDGLENGFGVKIYPNNRVYKGIFINGKIDMKYEIQKKLEICNE